MAWNAAPDTVAAPPAGATHRAHRGQWSIKRDGLIYSETGTVIVALANNVIIARYADGPSRYAGDSVTAVREQWQELLCKGWQRLGGGYVRRATPAELAGLRACPTCDAAAGAVCEPTCGVLSRRRAHPDWGWV